MHMRELNEHMKVCIDSAHLSCAMITTVRKHRYNWAAVVVRVRASRTYTGGRPDHFPRPGVQCVQSRISVSAARWHTPAALATHCRTRCSARKRSGRRSRADGFEATHQTALPCSTTV